METSRLMLAFVILVISQAVSAAEPVFATASETKYARELAPRKNKALVYIYLRQQDGTGVSPTIWLNNYKIGRLVPGSFTVWQLAPGRLNLKVGSAKPTTLSLISQAGKIYMFRITIKQSGAEAKAQLESLPGSYRSELAASRFIKNPRQVTPMVVQIPVKPAAPPATKVAAKPIPHRQPESRLSLQPGGIGVMFKTGSFSLSKQTQSILGADRSFDKTASGLYGIEVYYQFSSGLAYGGELLGYKAKFTTTGYTDTHDVSVHVLLANVKQYFRTDTRLQPYLGAGIGIATTSVSGPTISGSTAGIALQLEAGLEYRVSSYGFFGEAKYVNADTESSNNQKIDASGSGIFIGVSLHY